MMVQTRSNEIRNELVLARFRREGELVTVLVTDRRDGHDAIGSAVMFEVPCGDEAPELRANVPMFFERACTHYLRVTVDELGRVLVETVPGVAGEVEVLYDDPMRLVATTLPVEDFDDGEYF